MSALDQILLIPRIGRRTAATEFILEVKTDNAGTSDNDQMTLPIIGGTYNVDWGDSTTSTAVTGATTHTYLVSGEYTIKISGTFDRFNFNNGGDRQKLLTIDGLYVGTATTASGDFHGCGLPSMPVTMTLDSLTNGTQMFRGNSLTSLPASMTLANLTNGTQMFRANSLTSLPSGMNLPSLTVGTDMFQNNSITSLPASMTLASLTVGSNMFQNNSLTSLPSGMTLASLTTGTTMFLNNSLTSLPSSMTLASLTNGSNMFQGNTINTTDYSNLLIAMEENNANNNVPFHGGNSKYNTAGGVARAALVARGWTITDGEAE